MTGQIDDATARELITLVGPDWNQVTWYELFRATTEAKRQHTLADRAGNLELGLVPDLMAVPGGMLTWAAAAVAVWYFLLRKKH